MRKVLDQELQHLAVDIVAMGRDIQTSFNRVLAVMDCSDLSTCESVIEADREIDRVRKAIEQRIYRLMVMQQPLGPGDLRFLTATLSIVKELERIGDAATGIARLLLCVAPLRVVVPTGNSQQPTGKKSYRERISGHITEEFILRELQTLASEAMSILRKTVIAYEERDVQAARQLHKDDENVDVRYNIVRHDIMTTLSGLHALETLPHDAYILQRMNYYLWIAHKLERVADHCSVICARMVFLVDGERSMEPVPVV